MTVLEQRYMERVPDLLRLIAEELRKINETLKGKENGTDLQRHDNRQDCR